MIASKIQFGVDDGWRRREAVVKRVLSQNFIFRSMPEHYCRAVCADDVDAPVSAYRRSVYLVNSGQPLRTVEFLAGLGVDRRDNSTVPLEQVQEGVVKQG